MDLFKRLGLAVASVGLTVCGGVVIFTAIAGTALAVPQPRGPEIDPGSIVSAITLLMGSTMLLTGRRLNK